VAAGRSLPAVVDRGPTRQSVAVSDGRLTPLRVALDLFVFAPLGAAVRARELVPELAELGRRHVTTNLNNYRAVGELAVGQLRRQSGARRQASADEAIDATAQARVAQVAQAAAGGGSAPAVAAASTLTSVELAIQDYDELSAVQVLPRLSDLRASELRTLADYESTHRGRETILGRIEQLLGPHRR